MSELQSEIQKLLCLLCAPLYWSAFSHSAKKKNLTDQDIVKTILELNSDAHSSQDEDISPHSDNDTNDITDTNYTQWTIQTVSLLYTTSWHGFPMGYEKKAPHFTED